MTNEPKFLSYAEVINCLEDLRDQSEKGMLVFPDSFDIVLASLEQLKRNYNAARAGHGVLSKVHEKLKKAHEKLKMDFKWLQQTKAHSHQQTDQAREQAKFFKSKYEKLYKDFTAFRSIIVLQLDSIFNEVETLESQGIAVDEDLRGMLAYLWSYVKANGPKDDAIGDFLKG